VGICRKYVKATGFLLDIADNRRRKLGRENLGRIKHIKKETGLRCGGRGKSEISSAL